MSRSMHLLGFMLNNPISHSAMSWADPDDGRAEGFSEPAYWQHIAQVLERGRFDGIFFADAPFAMDTYKDSLDAAVRYAIGFPTHDPLPLVPIMALATDHLGFAVTMSTNHAPYSLVRTFGTLDHLTKGRVGWNVVTDFHKNLARNLGLTDLPPHDKRYDRADEYMEVCTKLWDSWESDAVIIDKEALVYADPSKVHRIDHAGEYFSCVGPSAVEPSPQGRPVIFQAGSSPRGRNFAAEHAEVAFSIQRTPEGMRSFTEDMAKRVADVGNDPGRFKVLFGVMPIVGESDQHAAERLEEMQERVPLEASLARLSSGFGVDLDGWDLDAPLEHQEVPGVQGMMDMFTKMMPGKVPTVREAARVYGFSIGMPTVVGSAQTVADTLEQYFHEGGGDGFNISVPTSPAGFERFVDGVVPILQDRGVLRRDYTEGQTFRERLLDG